MTKSVTKIMLALIITLFTFVNVFSQSVELDSLSLIAIYDSTDGANWTNNSGWELHDRPLDQWDGVTIDETTRRVTILSLGNNNLNGRLPEDIGSLTELQTLLLDNCPNLTGPLPPTIGTLLNLRVFQLWNTGLSGPIPQELTLLIKLENLYLANSNFDGPIPGGMDELINLKVIGFGRNNLTGPIPSELGNMVNLEELYLNGNQLSGEIPPELGNHGNLKKLWLHDNNLVGPIPPELYNLVEMDHFVLEGNEFIGEILPEINNMTIIRTIRFGSNNFSKFPVLHALNDLTLVDIKENRLNFGDIEPNVPLIDREDFKYWPQDSIGMRIDTVLHPGQEFTLFTSAGGDCTIYHWKKDEMDVSEPSHDSTFTFYSLTMEDDGRYICEITNTVADQLTLYSLPITIHMEYTPRHLDSLALVDLYNSTDGANWNSSTNWLSTEKIDTWQGISMSDNRVSDIQLSNQKLTGVLPPSIGNLNRLENLYLANNSITGAIPVEIGMMTSLEEIWLNSNNLNQPIPGEITNLVNLERLHLTYNQISGPIPEDIGNMTKLWDLAMADNELQGNIPAGIASLVNLQSLWLAHNNLSGSLPENIGDLAALTGLSLADNGFQGAVPGSIISLTALTNLELKNNQLDELPDLSDLVTNLNSLYIESNKFTFEDIEPNMGVANDFTYSPQDSVGLERDTSLTSGSSITLDAGVGGGNNKYQWYHNETSLSSGTNSTLLIDSIDETTIGTYYCQVYNTVVTGLDIYTRPVHVGIMGPPSVITKPATNISTNSVDLNGEVSPNGLSTTVSFLYSTNQADWTTISAIPGTINGSGGQAVSAALSSLPNKTTFWFKVSASNSEGTKEGEVLSFQTLSLESPPTVSTAIPTSITPTSAYLSGTVNPNDLPTDAFFQFTDSVEIPTNQSTPLSGIININVNASATNLTSDTNYQLRLVAVNDSGRTNGTWVSFRTLLPGSGPSATTNPADQITSTSARLNGLVNPGGKQSDVVFYWGETTGYTDSIFSSSGTVDGATDVAVNATINGLTPGTPYHYIVKVTNEDGQVSGNDIGFSTLFPAVNLSAPTNAATDISVRPNFQWKEVINAQGYRLEVATDNSFSNIILNIENIQNTSYTSLITLDFGATYYWHVSVDANDSPPVWSTVRSFTTSSYPATINLSTQISFPSKENNSDFIPTEYRIFGLPGSSTIALSNIFGNSAGEKWIAYWDNGQPENYKIKYEQNPTFEFQTGKAFWIIYNGSLPISQKVDSPVLNEDQQAEIPLHSGWNLIANPFDFDVAWSEVQQINSISQPLYRFDGSFKITEQMMQFEGYYYFNQSGSNVLRIPVSPGMPKLSNRDNFEWRIDIDLASGEQVDHSSHMGIVSDASPGIDRYDYRKPRAMIDIPSVNFIRPEWDEHYPVFANDIRPGVEGLEIWKFQTDISSLEKSVLTFTGVSDIPVDYEVFLIDKSHFTSINLREDYAYTFNPGQKTSHFELVVGEKLLVQEKIDKVSPTEFALEKNYPNPFNTSTTICIMIPEKSKTSLKIYNVLGQDVMTLYNGNLEAGRHFFKWSGTDNAGKVVPSGVYIYSMVSDQGQQFARKMVLLK